MKKLILIFLIFSFALILFSKAFATKITENIEKILIATKEKLEREAFPVFKKIWRWFKENIWGKILSLFEAEYEKRKLEVKKEFKEKTEEMRKELSQFLKMIQGKIYQWLKK